MGALPFTVPSLLTFEPAEGSPEPGDSGLLLAGHGATFSGGRLRLDLRLAWSFPARWASTFQRLTDAVVLVVEDAGAGAAVALRAVDPHKKYTEREGPNWRGPPPPELPPGPVPDRPAEEPLPDAQEEKAAAAAEAGGADEGPPGEPSGDEAGWMSVPAELETAPPPWTGPSVFVTARLHGHVSNTLALELGPGGVATSSFLWGKPWEPARHAAGEPPAGVPRPPPGKTALELAPREGGPPGAGALEARLRLPPADLAAGGPEAWLRSVFVTAVLRGDQLPVAVSWLGDRLALRDDLPPGGEARLPFALRDLFAGPLPSGTWDVQVSARHHRSPILEVTLP